MSNGFPYKIPQESPGYPQASAFITEKIAAMIAHSIVSGGNLIFIHTNLKRGLPLENINKVAGPFVEAWALEQFEEIANNLGNDYGLVNVQAGKRLDPFDIVLQFKRQQVAAAYLSANVDVKATAGDIKTSGKSPNITSFARIRSEYLDDPDYIFIILSLKHKVYGERDAATGMTNGVMEVVASATYDLKYISAADLNYNPALGTGQLQIRDIHYVTLEQRTTWEFLQLLDAKFIRSKGEAAWLKLARQHEWIKVEEP
ncbi:MAG: restriction endonuclease [Acidobacteria bacterium]|nr:restriction endonuclease [Acidobacteriota bacterium]MBI3426947.1 restriction endonuclease [Acidobacteriota bacterium]